MSTCLVKLGEICEIISGGTPDTNNPDFWNGEHNWIAPNEIKNDTKYINETKRKITDLALEKKPLVLMPAGTVLLSSRAPIGKVAISKIPLYCNQGFKNLICNDKLNNEYLYYYLIFKHNYLNTLGRGVTFKELSRDSIASIYIPLPSIYEQIRIASILDKVDSIIRKRKQSLKLLDDLAQARFVEMFGDPIINNKKWKLDTLKLLTTKIGSGATPQGGRASYAQSGISLIRSMNVYDRRFNKEGLAYISQVQAEKLDNVEVISGDVLINITGASVTRSCIVPESIMPARVNQHVALIRCNPDKLNPYFVNSLLINDSFKSYLLLKASQGGATREALTKEILESLPVILPSIEHQQEFALNIKKIDEMSHQLMVQLNEAETLKAALMQEYFGG